MTTIDPVAAGVRPVGRVKRRLLRMLIVVTAVLGAVGLTAGPASAAQNCKTVNNAFVCLAINRLDNGLFAVLVGIEVHMSVAEAQEYVDDPDDPFTVEIRGDDGNENSPQLAEHLFTLPITGLGASDEFGLSADFERQDVQANWLNEDNGQDEIRALVTLIDTDTNTVTATYISGRIVGNWP
jgi:hypothetical protein